MSLHRTLFVLSLFLFSGPLTALDQEKLDSLKAQLDQSIPDSTRSRLLFEMAQEVGAADTVLAFSLLEQGKEIAEQQENTEGLGTYHKILGKVFSHLGSYKRAIGHFDRALVYYREADDQVNYHQCLKEKGNVYLFQADFEQALNHYRTALDFYKRNHMTLGISRCLNNMGIIHKNRGEYAEALSAYQESLLFLDSTEHAYDISQAYINMGNVFVYLGAFDRALEYFGRALTISERENFQKNISLCLSNAGVVHNKIHDYEEALNLYQRSLKVSQSLNDPVQMSNCLINIGTNYADMGEPEKGIDFVEKGMQMKLELGDDRAISNCNIHLADIYAAMMEHEKATALYETALLQKEQLEEPDGIIRCYLGLGSVRLFMEQLEEAGRFADLALEKARQINAREYLASASRIKADLAVKQGDYRSAYQYLSQYHLYQDSLMDDATAKMAMEMELRNNSRLLQQENENLRIQANLDQLEMRKRTLIFRSSLVIATLLAVGLILVLYFLRKLRKTSLKLEEKNLVITKQNLKLDQVNKTQDRVMSIIAHDLRGTIGNQLTAVEVLHRIEGENQVQIDRKRLLGNLKNSASYSLELLENLLHWTRLEEGVSSFHPEELRLNTLVSNCVSLFAEAASNKGIQVRKEINGPVECMADRIMMETIFRNLISNAIKFSNPGGTITFSLKAEDGMVRIRVTDQGIGMGPEQIQKLRFNGGYTRRGTANEKGAGMGLTLVREFTHAHRGELVILSEPGKGSTFEVSFPCAK
jgi:signal transduction histidine kinase/Tfp pilus assembly protein PilF